MNYQQIIDDCVAHVRESQRFTPSDWKRFINLAQMEIQKQTEILEGSHEVVVMQGQRLYSMRQSGLYRLTEDPRLGDVRIGRTTHSALVSVDLAEEGEPRVIYSEGAGVFGLWPVPDEATSGKILRLFGKHAPSEVTAATPLSDEPPFEYIDHPTVMLGALLQAERVDKDLAVGDRVKTQYIENIMHMRGRATNRIPGVKRVKPRGR